MRSFAFYRPTEFIASIFITRIARFVGLPENLGTILVTLFRLSTTLISTVGFNPVLRVLLRLPTLIIYNLPIAALTTVTSFLPLNQYVVTPVTELLAPVWKLILKNN